MKQRNTIPYLIVLLIVVLLVSGMLWLRQYTPKYAWKENLNKKNEHPYGMSILYDLLKESYPGDRFVELTNANFEYRLKEVSNATYVFVGTNYFIDSVHVPLLLDFAYRGNNVFIASTYRIGAFIDYWFDDSTISAVNSHISSDTILTKFNSRIESDAQDYTFYFQALKTTAKYDWQYFDSSFINAFPDVQPQVLSQLNDTAANLLTLPMGSGTIYFYSTPIFLSNYHIIREDTYDYMQNLFGEVLRENIIWDSYSATPYNKPNYSHLKESPLRFILKHRSFRWAWYLLVAGSLVYVLIQSKRKQSTIRLIQLKDNNTLEYARAIGLLYFQAKSHRFIATEMMNQFSSFIKIRYNIKFGKEKAPAVDKLAKVSGIRRKEVDEIFKLEVKLKYNDNPESEDLYQLYHRVNNFYKNCN